MSNGLVHAHQAALRRLNKKQWEALDELGNVVLLAGPGSGKTATLVLKIARLLDLVPSPQGVACLTYGTEAAREFEKRLDGLGIRRGGRLFTGTLHAFCLARVLRPFHRRLPADLRYVGEYEVASEDELRRARELGLEAAGVREPENWWGTKISAYRRLVLIEPSRSAEVSDLRIPAIAQGYTDALRRMGRIDFDDIINASLRLIEGDDYVRRVLAAKYPWFVVDEYQDLGLALHRMITALMDRAGVNVFAVGDPDQSIYGFAGARPEVLDALAKRTSVRVVRLELNYRCGQKIIDASLHVLQPEEERQFRYAEEEDPNQGEIFFHGCDAGLEEQAAVSISNIRRLLASGVLPGDIGILAKRNADLLLIGEQLAKEGVPYRVSRSPTYKPTALTMLVEDMATWCAGGWRQSWPRFQAMFAAWERILVGCRRVSRGGTTLAERAKLFGTLVSLRSPEMEVGTWLASIDRILHLTELLADTSVPLRMRHDVRELGVMLSTLSRSRQSIEEFSGLTKNKLVVQSIHGSKGLEYKAVFVPGLENGVLPQWNDDLREARRLFYVAITRAKSEVHLLWSGFFYTAEGKLRQNGPSPLLVELYSRIPVS